MSQDGDTWLKAYSFRDPGDPVLDPKVVIEVHDKERDMYVCLNLEQMKSLIKDLTVMADLIHLEKTPTIRFD